MRWAVPRQRGSLVVWGLLALLLTMWHVVHGMTLAHPSLISGWALTIAMVVLTAYNLRKKLSFLPLARSSHWLRAHVYLSFLSLLLFALHVGDWRVDGVLEVGLAVMFLAVAGSGLCGLYISRRFPPLLATRGEEVIFERIPGFCRRLGEEAQEHVLRAAATGSRALPELYERRLHEFFCQPRHRWAHLRESRHPVEELLGEMRDLRRYLNDDEQGILDQLEDCVRAKDDLDYHHAHQFLLKTWLLVHLPLAYVLVLLTAVHVLLVHAFGGIR